jgi:hypothetical protein
MRLAPLQRGEPAGGALRGRQGGGGHPGKLDGRPLGEEGHVRHAAGALG